MLLLCAGCPKQAAEPQPDPPVEPVADKPAPPAPDTATAAPPAKVAEEEEEEAPPRPTRRRPKGASDDEALNEPPLALLLADRLDFVDKIITLRVTAEPGDYYNCYYKGKRAQYHHLRVRGDGSTYLDAYLPRDPTGEKLWVKVSKQKSMRLTLRVIMRPQTISSVCVGQAEILAVEEGWRFDRGLVAAPGALKRRFANAKDATPAKNRPSVATLISGRHRFIDKAVELRVRARLGRSYQCRYRDAERTHYAVILRGDGFKALHGYIKRSPEGKKLAARLASDEDARITINVTIPKGRYDELCDSQVEILNWAPDWAE